MPRDTSDRPWWSFRWAFLAAVLIWVLPAPGRNDPLLWLVIALVIGSCLTVMAGNIRVINAIGGETWTDAQAGQLGPTRPGFESGHDLAIRGAWAAILATMLAAGELWRPAARRLVSAKVAAAAAALSLIFPYWILPGFGIVVLVLSAVVARSRRLRAVRGSQQSIPTG